VPVGVGLDHREHLHVLRNVLADRGEVRSQRRTVDLGYGGSTFAEFHPGQSPRRSQDDPGYLCEGYAVVKAALSSKAPGAVTTIVNGERRRLEDGATISELVAELDLAGRRIAVEVNREIVPASEYARRQLHEGDAIEIVHFVGGG
jgi:sulfur carrier protein